MDHVTVEVPRDDTDVKYRDDRGQGSSCSIESSSEIESRGCRLSYFLRVMDNLSCCRSDMSSRGKWKSFHFITPEYRVGISVAFVMVFFGVNYLKGLLLDMSLDMC